MLHGKYDVTLKAKLANLKKDIEKIKHKILLHKKAKESNDTNEEEKSNLRQQIKFLEESL